MQKIFTVHYLGNMYPGLLEHIRKGPDTLIHKDDSKQLEYFLFREGFKQDEFHWDEEDDLITVSQD